MKNLIFALIAGLAVLCITGCSPDDSDGASDITEMTIYNIPVQIPILGKSTTNNAYKLYLSASNSMKATDPPATQAVVILDIDNFPWGDEPGYSYEPDDIDSNKSIVTVGSGVNAYSYTVTKNATTYSVTFPLRKPINPKPIGEDPNKDDGPWTGRASFFSMMLCPQDVTVDGVDSVFIKASSSSLNSNTANLNWNKNSLNTFNDAIGGTDPLDFEGKRQSLYDEIVLYDPHIDK